MAGFVGQDRVEMRDRLVERLDRLSRGQDLPRVIVLEADSGFGKSRVVREFYESLRVGRHDEYWPSMPEPVPGEWGDALSNRKVLGPRVDGFVWASDVVPTFSWWELPCDRMQSGALVDAVGMVSRALMWHGRALDCARKVHDMPTGGGMRAAVANMRLVQEEFRTGILEEISANKVDLVAAVAEALGASVPGAAQVLRAAGVAAKAVRNATAWQRDRSAELTFGSSTDEKVDMAAEVGRAIRGSSRTFLPAIVVIEDAHLMGPEMSSLIRDLSTPEIDRPVLTIATAWPEGRANPVYAQWLEAMKADGRLEVWALHPLPEDVLTQILLDYAPQTAPDLSRHVVDRWRNPYALELFLTSEAMSWAFTGEGRTRALECATQDLEGFPNTIVGLYASRWQFLPEHVRSILRVAAGALPEQSLVLEPFVGHIIAAAVEIDPHIALAESGIDSALADSRDQHWTTPSGVAPEIADTFREIVQVEVASADVPAGLRRRIRVAVVHALCGRIDEIRGNRYRLEPKDPEVKVCCEWLTALAGDEGFSDEHAQVPIAVAKMTVARVYGELGEYVRALEVMDSGRALAPLWSDHVDTLECRQEIAFWLHEAGDYLGSRVAHDAVIDDATRVLGPDHFVTLFARFVDAQLLREDYDLCLQLFEPLVEAVEAARGIDCDDVRSLRQHQLILLLLAGRPEEAVEAAALSVARQTTTAGAVDSSTLALRTIEVLARLVAGEEALARNQAAELRSTYADALGPSHPESLLARYNMSMWLQMTVAATIDDLDELHRLEDDCTRSLGMLDRLTLNVRELLASVEFELDLADESLLSLTSLVEDTRRAFGELDGQHLEFRRALLRQLALVGSADVKTEAREFVHLCETELGPEHLWSIAARETLVQILRTLGDIEADIEELRILAETRTKTLGREHPETVSSVFELALDLNQVTDDDKKIDLWRTAVMELVDSRGPENDYAIAARTWLVQALGVQGHHDQAVSECRALVEDLERLFGPDHLDSLDARYALADHLDDQGSFNESLEVLADLIPDYARILGEEHPDTSAAEMLRADVLGRSGKLDVAVANYEALIQRLEAMPGGSPEVLPSVYYRHSSWCAQATDPQGTVTACQRFLEKYSAHEDKRFEVVEVRLWLIQATGEADRAAGAVTLAQELVADLTLSDPGDVRLFEARKLLAVWTGKSGDWAEATSQLEILLDDQGEVLGADHWRVQDAQWWRAFAVQSAGYPGSAFELFRTLGVRIDLVDGPSSQASLNCWSQAASCLEDLGDFWGCAEILGVLAQQLASDLGLAHERTVSTRWEFAEMVGRAGQPVVAADALRGIAADLERRDLAVTRQALKARMWAAIWLGRADCREDACALLEELISFSERILGVDDEQTLETRSTWIFNIGNLGDATRALTECQVLVSDKTRVLGPNHPDTLNERWGLAHWLRSADDTQAAADQVRLLLADTISIHGEEHLETAAALGGLAELLMELDEASEAVTLQGRSVIILTQLEGPADHSTIDARLDLADMLLSSGEYERAWDEAAGCLTLAVNEQGASGLLALRSSRLVAYSLWQMDDRSGAISQFERYCDALALCEDEEVDEETVALAHQTLDEMTAGTFSL